MPTEVNWEFETEQIQLPKKGLSALLIYTMCCLCSHFSCYIWFSEDL